MTEEAKKQLSLVLDELADLFINRAAEDMQPVGFTETDLINAVHIFQGVSVEFVYKYILQNKVSDKKGVEMAEIFGNRLRDLIVDYTGFDTHKYYKKEA